MRSPNWPTIWNQRLPLWPLASRVWDQEQLMCKVAYWVFEVLIYLTWYCYRVNPLFNFLCAEFSKKVVWTHVLWNNTALVRYFSSASFNNNNVSCECENPPLSVLETDNIVIITVKCASDQYVLSTSKSLFPVNAYLCLVNIVILRSCIIIVSMQCSC